MVKTLLKQTKEYKKYSLMTMGAAALEVVLEILIPLLMAGLIDNGIEALILCSNVLLIHLNKAPIFISSLSMTYLQGRKVSSKDARYKYIVLSDKAIRVLNEIKLSLDEYSLLCIISQ